MLRLHRIKVGDEIKFTEDYLDFWYNEAFTMCSKPEGIKNDEDAKDYLIRKILSLGYSYKAVVLALREDVGDGVPGFLVKVILPHGLQDTTHVACSNCSLYKKKEKKNG